jgi:hypothetical protein
MKIQRPIYSMTMVLLMLALGACHHHGMRRPHGGAGHHYQPVQSELSGVDISHRRLAENL